MEAYSEVTGLSLYLFGLSQPSDHRSLNDALNSGISANGKHVWFPLDLRASARLFFSLGKNSFLYTPFPTSVVSPHGDLLQKLGGSIVHSACVVLIG